MGYFLGDNIPFYVHESVPKFKKADKSIFDFKICFHLKIEEVKDLVEQEGKLRDNQLA